MVVISDIDGDPLIYRQVLRGELTMCCHCCVAAQRSMNSLNQRLYFQHHAVSQPRKS